MRSVETAPTPATLTQRLRPNYAAISRAEFLRRVRENGAIVEKYVGAGPGEMVRYPSVSACYTELWTDLPISGY